MEASELEKCERDLFSRQYPKGCTWKLIFRESGDTARCDFAWWSLNLTVDKNVYLVTRISEHGQLASALRIEPKAFDTERDFTPFHFSRTTRHLHLMIVSLWNKDWEQALKAMDITPNSGLLHTWATILDGAHGGSHFTTAHALYLKPRKVETPEERHAIFNAPSTNPMNSMTNLPTKPPHSTSPKKRKPSKKKSKKPLYEPIDWDNRWG